MLARVLDNWLTSASERSYQGPFAQLLLAEHYQVLFAPVHHPFEQGKDLVAIAPDGALCAYQLKGGNVDLSAYNALQQQLFTLCVTAVNYPGVEPPRRPDRVFLVTNGNLTPPARASLSSMNDGNRQQGLPPVELIEREQLIARFERAHGEFLPSEPVDFNELLALFLDDGCSEFDVRRHAALVTRMIAASVTRSGTHQPQRALASAVLLTAVVLSSAQRKENHLAVAQGWLSMALLVLVTAADKDLPESAWRQTYEIARDSARAALLTLLDEAASNNDLLIPDLVEGLVYPTRACIVTGYLAALLMCERQLEGSILDEARVRDVIARELPHVKAVGECCAPHFYLLSVVLDLFNRRTDAAALQYLWATVLAERNHPGREDAVADPYHTIEEALTATMEGSAVYDGERFDGQAYTLHIALYWLARRGLRSSVAKLWPAVTHVHFVEYVPSNPVGLMRALDETGQQHTWAPGTPQSWSAFVEEARVVKESELPRILWRSPEMLPFVPLLFPYRLTGAISKALDNLVHPVVDVKCDAEWAEEEAGGTESSAST